MLLRARDPNVQVGGCRRQQQQRETKRIATKAATKNNNNNVAAAPAHFGLKRQVANIVRTGRPADDDEEGPPKPKRNRNNKDSNDKSTDGSSILPDIADVLCLDSNKKHFSVGARLLPETTDVVVVQQKRRKPAAVNATRIRSAVGDKEGGFDFDREQARELTAMAQYSLDIFTYYRHREVFFRVDDYLAKQPQLSWFMRAEIVNWLVDLQETFELNHETLYLAVKLFDLFLSQSAVPVKRNNLQLLASTAMFVACKFDERAPPLIDDFIYLSEDAFTRKQMMAMERELLCVLNFDLGTPLSYRFLRRYARVLRQNMETLTLARYILETSLLYLEHCRRSESLMAAASLLLAMRMRKVGDWNSILERSAGHKLGEVEVLMWQLNRMIAQHTGTYGSHLDTVHRKYSHEVFFKVAATKPLSEAGGPGPY